MIPPDIPEISIIIVAYNSATVLADCLLSLRQQPAHLQYEIIVVDNASEDRSRQIVEEICPEARRCWLSNNLGYGAGCNAGAAMAQGRYLVFLNPDTQVEIGWLEPLVAALATDPTLGAASPKIVLMSDPSIINACGNDVQFTGFPSCHLLGIKASLVQEPAEVTSISGAAFIIERNLFNQLGRFDPKFFMYLEDTDLSWRLRLAGYHCGYIPQSIIRHHYTPSFSANKFFYLERNRYQLLVKNLQSRTLLTLIPALLLAEVSIWGYTILRGPNHIAAKFRACSDTTRQWHAWQHTNFANKLRHKVSDNVLLQACSARIAYDAAYRGWLAQLAAIIFDPFYTLFRSWAIALTSPDIPRMQ